MKVKCINNDYWGGLTISKTYTVITIYIHGYEIINDDNYQFNYPKSVFIPLSEYRNETIDKLLEDEN